MERPNENSSCKPPVPFLKWAGGKRWLATSSEFPKPGAFDRYLEPFLGGGAIFFQLRPQASILSDINVELIDLYRVVRDDPVELHRHLQQHHRAHSTEYYYAVRGARPAIAVERAARTLYLNRTCWNGLYRVNRQGEFNVPIGTKDTVLFENETFAEVSSALSRADIVCRDFESAIEDSVEGDFLFIDPPYTVQHNLNGFLKYNERIFSWSDQIRLRDAVRDAVGRGVALVMTNADHECVRELYRGICQYRALNRASVLAGMASRRGPTTEALFCANLS